MPKKYITLISSVCQRIPIASAHFLNRILFCLQLCDIVLLDFARDFTLIDSSGPIKFTEARFYGRYKTVGFQILPAFADILSYPPLPGDPIERPTPWVYYNLEIASDIKNIDFKQEITRYRASALFKSRESSADYGSWSEEDVKRWTDWSALEVDEIYLHCQEELQDFLSL